MNPCPKCGDDLKIRVTAQFDGVRFGDDGFVFDELELGENEATVYCASATCDFEEPFPVWQKRQEGVLKR